MKVTDSSKVLISDNFQTLKPLNLVLSIFGLECSFMCPKSKNYWVIVKTVITVSLLAALDFYTLNYKVKYLHGALSLSPSIMYTDLVQMVYDYTQYIVDLYYVRKYGTFISCEYFKQYATIDQILGTVNYSVIRRNLLILMGIFGVFWATSTVCDFTAWVLSYSWQESTVYSVAYIFLLLKILTTLDLTSQVMHIECRLRAVGNLMQSHCCTVGSSSALFDINVTRKKWLNYDLVNTVSNALPNTVQERSRNEYQSIKWLSRCYLLLTEQTAFVNKMYGIRILLNTLSLLIDMVRFINIAARILTGSQQTRYSFVYFPVVSSIMRMLLCAAVLVSLVWHCEQLYTQRDRILNIIDHLLIYKDPSEDIKTSASELRNLIQERPVELNMANFFRLNNSLLVSTASVVVTYTIILLQSIN